MKFHSFFLQQILCFNAYFRQNLSVGVTHQIRKVKILYYLEDGTVQVRWMAFESLRELFDYFMFNWLRLQVVEPRTDNSGIPQGCIVKRQKVPCCPSDPNKYLSIDDLNVQKQVTIFDRIYYITNCDGFTRSYLCRAGIEVPNPVKTPKWVCFVINIRINITLYII